MDWEPKFKIRIPMVVLESIFSFFSHWLDFSRQEYCPTYIWKGFCKPEIYVFTGNHQCGNKIHNCVIFRFSLLDKSSSKSSIACVLCLIKRRHFSIYASVKFWKIKVDNGMSTLLHLVLSSSCALKPVWCQLFCKIPTRNAKVEKQDIHVPASSSKLVNICSSKSHIGIPC